MRTTNHLINELIELNNDRVAGFHKAIDSIDDKSENSDIVAMFEDLATQSTHFSEELSQIVANNEGEPETGNSVTGGLHRAWIDLKSLFGGADRETILSEAERGEDIIKNAYHSVIQQHRLSGRANEVVNSQFTRLTQSHDQIKALRNLAR